MADTSLPTYHTIRSKNMPGTNEFTGAQVVPIPNTLITASKQENKIVELTVDQLEQWSLELTM